MSAEGKLKTVLVNNSIKLIENFTSRSHIYQENDNQGGPLEDVQFANDTEISFNTYAPGTTGVAKITNQYEFIRDLFIKLTIILGTDTSHLESQSNVHGISLIEEIRIKIPGMPHLQYDSRMLLYKYLDQCETMEKRNEFMSLVGGSDRNVNSTVADTKLIVPREKSITIYVPVPLPGTNLRSNVNEKSKPFPTHLLNSPLEIDVKWRAKNDFDTTNNEIVISSASLIFKYQVLGTAAQLKKSLYRYQYVQPYDYEIDIAYGDKNKTLSGLRAGETRELLLCFLNNSTDFPNDYFKSVVPTGLKLTYNGQVIWSMPQNRQSLENLLTSQLPSYAYTSKMLSRSTTTAALKPYFQSQYIFVAGDFTDTTPTQAQIDIAFNIILYDWLYMMGEVGLAKNAHERRFPTSTDANGIFLSTIHFANYFNILVNEIIVNPSSVTSPAGMTSANMATHFNDVRDLGIMNILQKRRFHWIKVPIADILERQQKEGDYSLGVDFNHSELMISWDDNIITPTAATDGAVAVAGNKKGKLLAQIGLNSVLSFDGGVAKLVQ